MHDIIDIFCVLFKHTVFFLQITCNPGVFKNLSSLVTNNFSNIENEYLYSSFSCHDLYILHLLFLKIFTVSAIGAQGTIYRKV